MLLFLGNICRCIPSQVRNSAHARTHARTHTRDARTSSRVLYDPQSLRQAAACSTTLAGPPKTKVYHSCHSFSVICSSERQKVVFVADSSFIPHRLRKWLIEMALCLPANRLVSDGHKTSAPTPFGARLLLILFI